MVLTCPNCGATAEIGESIESGQFVCAKCKSTVGFGPGTSLVLSKTDIKDELTGERLAGYEVKKLLGAGGMGKVYLARQVSIDRLVALKILAPRLAENPNFTKRFIREAQAAGKLLHPNLVTVFDAGKEGFTYFFSMEYVEGEAASRLIFEKGKLPPAEALGIVRQVAEALRYALTHGIIHRDIKPDNILITAEGHVKLADLGLAKQIEGGEDESGLTMAGSVMGTPHYLAPEQARNTRDVDQRADIYSLGCTLYHMLTGNVPFSGSSTYEILRKHETQEPAFAPDSAVPAPLQVLVKDMMAKDPAARPQRPADVIARIDGVLASRGTGAAAAPPATAVSMPTEPMPVSEPPVRITTPDTPATATAADSRPLAEPATPRARKSSIAWVLAPTVVLVALTVGFILLARHRRAHVPAGMFEKARRYAKENPQDTEGILRRYNEIVSEFEDTEWANKAKQAILDVGYKQLEDALRHGPGNLDRLLAQLKKIQKSTPDTKFAKSVGERIHGLQEARRTGVELEFRRFKEEINKLVREGKFREARTRVEVSPKLLQARNIQKQMMRFKDETVAIAELEQVAKGFYKAAFGKDWEKAIQFVDPVQVGDDKKKKAIQFMGNLFLGRSRARNYRVDHIDVKLPEGTAVVHGRMALTRRTRGGQTETKDVSVVNQAMRRDGKWYLRLAEKQKKPADTKPHRPHRGRPLRRPIRK